MDNLYSIMHRRFNQMRGSAKSSGKYVPEISELRALAKRLFKMECPCCLQAMTWRRVKGISNVITLQHDRSGSIRLICFRCNVRHGSLPGDSFYDLPLSVRQLPAVKMSSVRIYKDDFEWLIASSQPGFPLHYLFTAITKHWCKLTDRQKLNAIVASQENRKRLAA